MQIAMPQDVIDDLTKLTKGTDYVWMTSYIHGGVLGHFAVLESFYKLHEIITPEEVLAVLRDNGDPTELLRKAERAEQVDQLYERIRDVLRKATENGQV